MTVMDAIQTADALRPNMYDDQVKMEWLRELDGRIKAEILNSHEGFDENISLNGAGDRELLVKEPYTEMYIYWLFMKIDYMNGETDRFNNDALMHNTAWLNYANYVNRTHMPKGTALKGV